MADLRQVADAASGGLGVGLHIHRPKPARTIPTSLRPGRSLAHGCRYTLAADVPAAAATLTVRENPAATLDDGRRLLKFGKN